MSFLVSESLILIIYLKFGIQQYITCQVFFCVSGFKFGVKVQKYPIFTEKNDVTLNIIKVKCTINFQAMPFMVQNKTQIASNTHRYKKTVNKILAWKWNHSHKLIYQKMSHVTFLIKKWSYKKNWTPNTQEHFFNCYLTTPGPTLGYFQGERLTSPMLITAFLSNSTRRSPGAS